MAGPSINWNQYPTADPNTPPPYLPTNTAGTMTDAGGSFTGGRTMDPSQALPNTGINGGATMTDQNGSFAGGGFTPTAAQLPPAANGVQGGGGGKDAFGQAWMASGGRTVQDLKNFVAAHPEYGVKLGGSKGDKVYGPDGSFWADAVISAGTGGNGASWDTGTGGGSSVNGSAGQILGGMGYNFGSSMAPYTGQFTAPTAEQALNTPGLQFALEEANRMGQNSAAAKGTLLNGRFQQALNASNIQNVLQGYGDVFNRQQQLQGLNYGVFKDNQDRPFNKNLSLAELGKPA